MLKVKNLKVISHQLGTCVGIISQPENRSVEELDQPDGTLASGSDDRTIKIWNTITGQEIKTLTGHTDYVDCLILLNLMTIMIIYVFGVV